MTPKKLYSVTAVGAAAALSLAAVAGEAAASSPQGAPTGHVVHTHLTLHATKERVTKHDSFKASVTARLRAKKAPVSGESVSLEQRQKGATKWVDTGDASVTDQDGKATFSFTQSQTKKQYRVVFAGDTGLKKSHSGVITITRLKPAKK